jgi:hypothetical protein
VICKICEKDFIKEHFNQKLCSLVCKRASRKAVLKRHKATEKWNFSNKKWQSSERFKSNERAYRQKPIAKKKAVARSAKQLEKPYYVDKKKRCDRIYMSRTQGKMRTCWAKESVGGCKFCGSKIKLSVDHIIPIIFLF